MRRRYCVNDTVIPIRSTRACGFYKMSVLTKRALMTALLFVALCRPNHISSSDRIQRRNGLHAISPALESCITRFLHSARIMLAGFAEGMPIKIRVMPDCIVIPHHTRELYGCAEELSVAYVNKAVTERVGYLLRD